MNLESLETLIASPYFLAAIVACGIWLLLLVSREFVLWFLNLVTLEKKLSIAGEAIIRIEAQVNILVEQINTLKKTKESEKVFSEDVATKPKNPEPTNKSAFPLSH